MRTIAFLISIVVAQQYDSLFVDNQWRTFWIYVPASYYNTTKEVPLILNLHGYTSNGWEQMFYSEMNQVADTAGFIVVYPEGTFDLTGNRYWNAGFSVYGANDTLFLNVLIDTLLQRYRIRKDAIFFCGMSNGGIMSYYMACFAARHIKAIGSVAGTPARSWFPCTPTKTIPLIHFHGTQDNRVPYQGNQRFYPVDSTLMEWENFLQCYNTYSTFIDSLNDSTAVEMTYWKCDSCATMVKAKIFNGGHTWPGASFYIGTTTKEIHASSELWNFFRCFISPSTIQRITLQQPYPTPSIQVNGETIQVCSLQPIRQLSLYAITGERIATYFNNHSCALIPAPPSPGFYLLKITYERFTIVRPLVFLSMP